MEQESDLASRRLLAVTEEELSRIVLDIHDGPVQYLFASLSLLTRLQRQMEARPDDYRDLLPTLNRASELVEESLHEIKSFLGTFRPPEFHRRSLSSIVQGLVIQHEEWTGHTVELTMEALPDNVTLPANTPMIVLGDFNLVGPSPQPEITLLTGDIVDNATFGPDVKGDWDVSDITDLTPADPFTGDTFTWQGNQTYPPSRLDRFMFTDSVTAVAHSFVLNTLTMTDAARAAAGVQANDTSPNSTSDHLPMAMDVHFLAPQTCHNPFADADGDGDVDQEDFGAWQACVSGGGGPAADACYCFDRDHDADVDGADLAAFLTCSSGPSLPADPGCDGAP